MSAINIAMNLLREHEGFRQFPYRCTVGRLTIGYGRNLDARGIDAGEAEILLKNDVLAAATQLSNQDFWGLLNEVRQAVLIDMAVNLGVGGLLKFKKMCDALLQLDYERAADEMLASKWATQVGKRAQELAEAMKSGV